MDTPWYSRVMPCADACLRMKKVHLTLLCCPLLCKKTNVQLVKANFGDFKKDNVPNKILLCG